MVACVTDENSGINHRNPRPFQQTPSLMLFGSLKDGIVTLILAVMIWMTWPSSTAWVIGTLLVGISMLFSGTSRLMLSLTERSVASKFAWDSVEIATPDPGVVHYQLADKERL